MVPLFAAGFLLLFVSTQASASKNGSMWRHRDGHGLMRVKALGRLVVQSDGKVLSHSGSTSSSELHTASALADRRLDAIPWAHKRKIFRQLMEASSRQAPQTSTVDKAKLHTRGRLSNVSLIEASGANERNIAPRCAESARDADFASLTGAPFVHFTANGHDAMLRGLTTAAISGNVYALAEWCLSTGSSVVELERLPDHAIEYVDCNCSKGQAFDLKRDAEDGAETSAEIGTGADSGAGTGTGTDVGTGDGSGTGAGTGVESDIGTVGASAGAGVGAGIATDTKPTPRSDASADTVEQVAATAGTSAGSGSGVGTDAGTGVGSDIRTAGASAGAGVGTGTDTTPTSRSVASAGTGEQVAATAGTSVGSRPGVGSGAGAGVKSGTVRASAGAGVGTGGAGTATDTTAASRSGASADTGEQVAATAGTSAGSGSGVGTSAGAGMGSNIGTVGTSAGAVVGTGGAGTPADATPRPWSEADAPGDGTQSLPGNEERVNHAMANAGEQAGGVTKEEMVGAKAEGDKDAANTHRFSTCFAIGICLVLFYL